MLSNSGTPFSEHGFGLLIADLRRLDLALSGGTNDMNQGATSVSQENLEDTSVSYEARQLWSVPITSLLPSNGQVLTYDGTSNQWGPGTISVSGYLAAANNLSDLSNAVTARTNLGLGTAATFASTAFLQATNNLSDVANAATARSNLGITTSGDGVFFAYQASNSSVADATTNQDLTFTELFDPDSAYNPATGVFTAPSTGYYTFVLAFAFGCASSTTFTNATYVQVEIQASTSKKVGATFYPYDSSLSRTIGVTYFLTVGDTVKSVLTAYSSDIASSGTLLGTTGAIKYLNYFYGYRFR